MILRLVGGDDPCPEAVCPGADVVRCRREAVSGDGGAGSAVTGPFEVEPVADAFHDLVLHHGRAASTTGKERDSMRAHCWVRCASRRASSLRVHSSTGGSTIASIASRASLAVSSPVSVASRRVRISISTTSLTAGGKPPSGGVLCLIQPLFDEDGAASPALSDAFDLSAARPHADEPPCRLRVRSSFCLVQ